MLEIPILDNTERLLSQTPYFAAFPRHTVLHADNKTAASSYFSTIYGCLYNPVLNIFHCTTNGASAIATLRIVPDNKGSVAAVAVNETSAKILQMANEPGGTGRVWGFRRGSAGQDGLWLRTNAVAGSWSRIIGATDNDVQAIVFKTNGELWYNNTTAGNWYQLAAGAAGNAQTSTPANLTIDRSYDMAAASNYSVPDSIGIGGYNFGALSFALIGTSSGYNRINALSAAQYLATNNYNEDTDCMYVWDNAWATSPVFPTNKICRVPDEVVLYAKPSSQVNCGQFLTNLIPLNNTYTLAVAQYTKGANDYAASTSVTTTYARFPYNDGSQFKSHYRVSLGLINRVTKVAKFLGFFDVPFINEHIPSESTTEVLPTGGGALVCVSARLVNGQLDVLTTGKIGHNSSNVVTYGAILTQIPLLKLDF